MPVPKISISSKMESNWYKCESCGGEFEEYNRHCTCGSEKTMQYMEDGDFSGSDKMLEEAIELLKKHGM